MSKKEPELYAAEMTARAEERKQIRDHRNELLAATDGFGQDVLDARRRLRLPVPEGKAQSKKFGEMLMKYQIGLRTLASVMDDPRFQVQNVPDRLREWLRNPITETVATDEELEMCVELLRERQAQIEEDAA